MAFHRNILIHVRNFILIKFALYWNGIGHLSFFALTLQHFQTRFLHSWIFSILAGLVLYNVCFASYISSKKYPFINKDGYVMLINYFMIVGLTPSYSRRVQPWMNC